MKAAIGSLFLLSFTLCVANAAENVVPLEDEQVSPAHIPDSARKMVATLRKNGLTNDDIIEVCREASSIGSFSKKLSPSDKLPPGTEVDSYGTLRLTDPWRLAKLDAESIRQRAAQYAVGLGRDDGVVSLDPTGPYLLAAALEIGDEKSALVIYRRMKEEFTSDSKALDMAVTSLAWSRFLKGLDAFHEKRDRDAIAALRQVVTLKPFTKASSLKFFPEASSTLLAGYVKQSESYLPEIEARLKAVPTEEPKRADEAAYIAYWVRQIREIDGAMPGQPAAPRIWNGSMKYNDDLPEPALASDKLRQVGLPALPALLAVINDQTPTRTVAYWKDFHPQRYLQRVDGAAFQIMVVIGLDHGVPPPEIPTFRKEETPEERARVWRKTFADYLKAIPPGTKRLAPEAQIEFWSKHYSEIGNYIEMRD